MSFTKMGCYYLQSHFPIGVMIILDLIYWLGFVLVLWFSQW